MASIGASSAASPGPARTMDTTWVDSLVKQCRAQGVAPWVKQLGHYPKTNGADLILLDTDGKRSGNGEDRDCWPDALSSLKVRELPIVDSTVQVISQDENSSGQHEAELRAVEDALGQLACDLEPDEAALELNLRHEFIGCERKLFVTRQERAQIIAQYKLIYGPRRKWSEFLRAIEMPRQTAYDLLSSVSGKAKRTESVQKKSPDCKASLSKLVANSFKRQSAEELTPEKIADDAVQAITQTLVELSQPDRDQCLWLIMKHLGKAYRESRLLEGGTGQSAQSS